MTDPEFSDTFESIVSESVRDVMREQSETVERQIADGIDVMESLCGHVYMMAYGPVVGGESFRFPDRLAADDGPYVLVRTLDAASPAALYARPARWWRRSDRSQRRRVRRAAPGRVRLSMPRFISGG